MSTTQPTRAVVVTGAAVGIGAAIAEELGRQGMFVVTLDANVTVDGSGPAESDEQTTAERIVAAGGSARSVSCSVTDEAAVSATFQRVVEDFGALDAVVNVAGISRPTSFTSGSEPDWDDVLGVHLDGYLTVLRAALPLMTAAGHGRIVGVTSGSGWRAADTGAYGCAKRAVAALTWQIGRTVPNGVTVNALSPIAATRMVTAGLAAAASRQSSGERATTGGIALTGFPPPEHLGPIGAFLAGDELSWCSGRIYFSAGAEVALVAEPRLIEVARSRPVSSSADVLTRLIPAAFAPAESSQATGGGSSARFADLFGAVPTTETAPATATATRSSSTCVVVCDDPAWRTGLVTAVEARGVRCTTIDEPAEGFDKIAAQYADALDHLGSVDRPTAVVVAIRGTDHAARSDSAAGWHDVLADHAGLATRIRNDAAWARAVSDRAIGVERAIRLITLIPAVTPGGRSRAQAATQLSRAARGATNSLVTACTVSCESTDDADRAPVADLAAHLVVGVDVEALSGAELCAGEGWWGLRSHPAPSGTISFGGPSVPAWLNDAVRELVDGSFAPTRRGG